MKFDPEFLGAQQLNDSDQNYQGSIYSEVRKALFRNAYYLTWGEDGTPPLPTYAVTLGRVVRGILPLGKRWQFKEAAKRTVESQAILRWGHDGQGFRRLLHPNGVCLLGRWKIEQANPFSGYFRDGSEALVVARYSTCCTETRRGHLRSLSLVGSLFPTTNEFHESPLSTASFITQENIGGAKTDYINDAVLRNAPDTSPLLRGWGLPVLLVTGLVFKIVDSEPTIRQLYEIAELGKPEAQPTKAPKFMQLTVDKEQPRCDAVDFRDEILEQIYDRGDSVARRMLRFNIQVTDDGRAGRLLGTGEFRNWQTIGHMTFHEAVASYNGDFVFHAHHPKWRRDRNDPRSVFRQ